MLSDDSLISILLPAYNAEKYIAQSIDSILGQTYENFELFIADDGSTDLTSQIIDHYKDKRIKISHNSFNCGKTVTVNRLFQLTRGELIVIHDADDISLPNRLERQLKEFENHPSLLMCGTNFVEIDEKGFLFSESKQPLSYDEIILNISQQSQFHGPTMMIRKEVLDEIGFVYHPYFRDHNEDCDLAMRIVERGLAYNIPDTLYKYRIHEASLSKNWTARKRCTYSLIRHLREQRLQTGIDDLLQGREDLVEGKMQELLQPYQQDASLIHREAAAFQMYYRLYESAIRSSLKAVKTSPFNFKNYRLLQYCLRRAFFRF